MEDQPNDRARRVEKPWGYELIWAETPGYIGKVIAIEAGKRLSLQYHRVKDESIYVISGRMILYLESDTGELDEIELGPGDFHHVPTGRRHRFAAMEDVRIIEVSTAQLEDVVRIEDDYGREGTSAS